MEREREGEGERERENARERVRVEDDRLRCEKALNDVGEATIAAHTVCVDDEHAADAFVAAAADATHCDSAEQEEVNLRMQSALDAAMVLGGMEKEPWIRQKSPGYGKRAVYTTKEL